MHLSLCGLIRWPMISNYRCPRCQSPLSRHRTEDDHRGLFWVCSACQGRAVTLPVLRHLMDPKAVKAVWATVLNHGRDGDLACPMCQRSMQGVAVAAGENQMELDACRACHLMWFDAAELDQLPAKPTGDGPEIQLSQELREKLAIAKVKEIGEEARKGEWQEGPEDPWKTIVAMFGLPVEHENNVGILPIVTWTVALLCGIAFAISVWFGLDTVIREWGFIPAEAGRHGGLTVVVSYFLHGGLAHLIGNVYFLLIFGDDVEEHLGHLRFALLLLVAALAGDMAHGLLDPHQHIPAVGASGGISGIIVFYALQFPRARIGFLLVRSFFVRWISLPAIVLLLLWLGSQAFLTWRQLAGGSHVSALAHLGGAAVGVVAWLVARGKKSA